MLASDHNWKRMKEGDKNAFLFIYQENYKSIFSYGFSLCCDKELTKDCIQEIFFEIWNTRVSINPEVQNVRAYLCTWIRRKISRLQSRNIKERTFQESSDGFENNERPYEEILIAFQDTEQKKEKIARALNNLTKKQMEIIRLKFFENLSYEQIASETSLTIRTVYNTIYVAIQQLRKDISLAQQD